MEPIVKYLGAAATGDEEFLEKAVLLRKVELGVEVSSVPCLFRVNTTRPVSALISIAASKRVARIRVDLNGRRTGGVKSWLKESTGDLSFALSDCRSVVADEFMSAEDAGSVPYFL